MASPQVSSPEASSPPDMTVQNWLQLTDEAKAEFLKQHFDVKTGFVDLSLLTGESDLEGDARDRFAEAIYEAAKLAFLPDPLALRQRIDPFSRVRMKDIEAFRACIRNEFPTHREDSFYMWDPERIRKTEINSYKKLVELGGKPVINLQDRLSMTGDEASKYRGFAPWLTDWDGLHHGAVPPVFTMQLSDWTLFRIWWQWERRGHIAGKKALKMYLKLREGDPEAAEPETEARRFMRIGASFSSGVKKSFDAHKKEVKQRLRSYGFNASFQLSADPGKQDAWTTWVEYLDFNLYHLKISKRELREIDFPFIDAWDKLWAFRNKVFGRAGQQDVFGNAIETSREHLNAFFEATDNFRSSYGQKCAREGRIAWILKLLPGLKNAEPVVKKEEDSKKRKSPGDDNDNLPDTGKNPSDNDNGHEDDGGGEPDQKLKRSAKRAKTTPSRDTAPTRKAATATKTASAEKSTSAKKSISAKKAAPVKESVVVKKAAPAKKTASAKKPAPATRKSQRLDTKTSEANEGEETEEATEEGEDADADADADA